MTTLHDRLADLADDAPSGGPAPDLWDRGRRYHRRRRVGTIVIAAVAIAALLSIAGIDRQRSAPSPVPAGGPVGLPDRVWNPSPWLPTTDRPGQLVAITGADTGSWSGMAWGLVGISASSGDYAFFDLPDAEESGVAELAPDGLHVAYWLTGPTTDTVNTESGPVTGLAILDTTTGEVSRHWIPTEHGLSPDFLAWADTTTLVFSAGQIRGGDDDSGMDQSSSSFGTVTSWSIGGEPQAVVGIEPGADLQGAGHGQILVDGFKRDQRHLLMDVARPETAHSIAVPPLSGATGFLHFVALGRTEDRIALVPGNRTPNPVKAGPAGDLAAVPGSERTLGVVDWIDDETIVTYAFAGSGWEHENLYRVSLATGDRQEIVRFPRGQGLGGWQFATDLLDAPSVEGVKPPNPLDPRVSAGWSLAVVVAGGIALLWWRRRVRP